jgi:hypothetical protein
MKAINHSLFRLLKHNSLPVNSKQLELFGSAWEPSVSTLASLLEGSFMNMYDLGKLINFYHLAFF